MDIGSEFQREGAAMEECFSFISLNSSDSVVVLQLRFYLYNNHLTKHNLWAKGGSISLLLNNLFFDWLRREKWLKFSFSQREWRRRWCHLAGSLLYGNKEVTCGDSYMSLWLVQCFLGNNSFHSKPVNKIHVIKKKKKPCLIKETPKQPHQYSHISLY